MVSPYVLAIALVLDPAASAGATPLSSLTQDEGWNMDYGVPISPALARLIRVGSARKASTEESARIRRASARTAHPGLANDQTFVLLRRVDPAVLDLLSGAFAVNFIVTPSVAGTNLGSSNTGSNFFGADGRCLSGPICLHVPEAPPSRVPSRRMSTAK